MSRETRQARKEARLDRKVNSEKTKPSSTNMVGSNKGTAVTSAFAKIEEAAKKRREAAAEDKAKRQELRAIRNAKSAKRGSWVGGIVGLQGFIGKK